MRPGRAAALVAWAGLVALVAACSAADTLTDDSSTIEYKSAGKLPPLDVPPDLTKPARDERYQLPDTPPNATTLSGYEASKHSQLQPGSGSVLPKFDGLSIERAGDERWLVVYEPPEKVWPVLRSFWQENGFLIARDMPEAGIMETQWAENRAKLSDTWARKTLGGLLGPLQSTGERDKFRTRLERRPDGGTEIYISHRGLEEVYVDTDHVQTGWQPRPSDPGLEAEFLTRLMVRLGEPAHEAQAQVASVAKAPQHATLTKAANGSEVLEVQDPFDRAWRRVGLALDRVGFTVEDRDRQKGVYFVRYADPLAEVKNSEGLLGKLAFWRDSKPKVKAEQYQVAVVGADTTSRVQVLSHDGTADKSATASRILSLLHEQLK
ncbi:MAG: outer membrane protein assembly factor BamC [Burkholderiales bacterium]